MGRLFATLRPFMIQESAGDIFGAGSMRKHVLLVVAIVGGLFSTTRANAGPEVTLRWYGQSFFVLESTKGTLVAFDPHAIEAFGRHEVNADLVLMSHLHDDHTQIGVIGNGAKAKAVQGLRVKGKTTEWVPADFTFKDVHVRSVGTYHDTVEGMQRGKNTVFIVEVDGLRIVHLGDLGHVLSAKDVQKIGPVDVLLIPIGGVYTINGSEAKKVVEQLKPKQFIVPMHYGVKGYDDLLPADEFLEDQTQVRKVEDNKLVIDPAAKPKAPTVVILNAKN
jgi:L-ascorbate metabolism protein UlaG (beta-lactamase superfamily)